MFTNNKQLKINNEMVQVAVRCRPMNDTEIANNCKRVVTVEPSSNSVKIYDSSQQRHSDYCRVFTYDAAFDERSSQCEIYDIMVRPLVDAVLSGYNGTVFAYGQSGSGKTYTMEGMSSESTKGILPRTFKNIFEQISKSCNIQYLIRTSYLEIYRDEIIDLLSRKTGNKFELRESKTSGVYVKDISSFICKSEQEMNKIIETGRQNRNVASTNMNEKSSRSHAIVTITVEMKDLTGPLEGRVRVGKFNLIDLAGSERQNKTNAEGERLKEAIKINLSLSALGNVISALSERKNNYIPYRDSKLTFILKDSLGGNSKTVMIANIGPASYNYEESLNTLWYASRAKNIRNDPQINEDPVDALIRRYQDEIKRLKCQLSEQTVVNKCHKMEMLAYSTVDEAHNKESPTILKELSRLGSENDSITELGLIGGINSDGEKKEQQNEDVQELRKRIELMESKLLIGNNNIVEHTTEQEKALAERTYKINKIKQREKEMCESLDKEQEMTLEIKGDYHNLEQEVEIKSMKLSKALLKLQTTQQKITDARDEFNAYRRELEVTQQEILMAIKLKLLIKENLIPKEHCRQLASRLYFNEDIDCWKVQPNLEPSQPLPKPKSVEYMRRLVTTTSVSTLRKTNPVFRCGQTVENKQRAFRLSRENILKLDLIRSPRITKIYKSPTLQPAVNSILQTALQQEQDIDIDAANSSLNSCLYMNSSRKSFESVLSRDLRRNSHKTQSATNISVYPKARGLVPK